MGENRLLTSAIFGKMADFKLHKENIIYYFYYKVKECKYSIVIKNAVR